MEALKSAAFYVGAIGSKKNNDARRERLREFDVSDEEIARLRGWGSTSARRPPEIAVAILAEMTAVRHGVSEPSWAAKPERRFDPSLGSKRGQTRLKIVGLLLAAGSATRFGSDKLRHPSARRLDRRAGRAPPEDGAGPVIAVVRPTAPSLPPR